MIMQQLLGHVELILEANFIYLVVSLLVSGNTRLSFDRMDHTIWFTLESSLRQVKLAEGAVE